MTWEIALGIIAFVGFLITVGKPVLTLNTSIVKLNDSVNVLRDDIVKIDTANKEAHKRIWSVIDNTTECVSDHEKRISKAENDLHQHSEILRTLNTSTNDQEKRLLHVEDSVEQHEKDIERGYHCTEDHE